jgi:glycosyltransferase involved in cell wall biosynthesis
MSADNGPAHQPRRIGVVANTSWYLHNFRGNLIRALQADGHAVFAIGGDGEYAARLRAQGIEHRPVVFDGSGTRPWRELATVWALRRAFVRERIDVVLSYTPKGNIYSALALTGQPATLLMNVSGLGTAFAYDGLLARVVRALYRASLRRAAWVFFQNDDDMARFRSRNMVDASRTSRLPGSGVDLEAFRAQMPADRADADPLFLMVARLLWDKGIGEFAEAARRVKKEYPRSRFRLLGALVPDHRGGVPEATLRQWVEDGVLEYPGMVDDVRPQLKQADCVVLPSVYREGVPRSLLEAAASARPVIAADTVGCRDALDDGISGFLCKPRDPEDLARQMLRLLALSDAERRRMGEAGRAKMEREFDEGCVIAAYRQCLNALGHSGPQMRQK